MRHERRKGATPGSLFAGGAVLFLLLHLAASVLFPDRIWGAHHLRYAPTWAVVAAAIVLALSLVPRTRDEIARFLVRIDDRIEGRPIPGNVLLFLLAWGSFFLFRTRSLFLGDGYLITSVVEDETRSGVGTAGFVSLAVHRALLGALRAVYPAAGGAAPFVLTSTLAGAAVVLLARATSHEITTSRAGRSLLFGAIALSGGALLFCGYVEYYPLMQGALLLYLFLAVRYLRGLGSLAPPTLALAAAVLLHASAFALAPSWLLLLARGGLTPRRRIALLAPVSLIGCVAAWGLLRYSERFYRGLDALVPLFETGRHAYSFFDLDHFAFLANELLLLLGGALLLLLFPSPSRKSAVPRGPERDIGRFLAAAAALGALYLVSVDPWLGARDWDLLALPLFPFLLWIGHRRLASAADVRPEHAVLLAGLCFFHTFPWVAAQLDRGHAVAMTVGMSVRDPHYVKRVGRAPKALGVLLSRAGYDEEATLFFEKAAAAAVNPQDLFNLGTSLAKEHDFAGAAKALEQAIAIAPDYHAAYSNLAWCYIQSNEPDKAEEVLGRLIATSSADAKAYRFLGVAQAQKGNYEGAVRSFRSAIERDPQDGDAWARLGVACREMGKPEEAAEALRRAIAIDPKNTRARTVLETMEREAAGRAP